MKITLFALICILFSVNLSACEPGEVTFDKNNLCAKIQWINTPVLNQFISASVTLSADTSLKLNVIPWMVMPGHEHGSRPVVITAVGPTDYLVEKMYFMGGMMGEWFLRLQLLNDKKEVTEEVRVKVDLQ